MEKFDNTQNEIAAQKSLGAAHWVCSLLSTISSTVGVWTAAMAYFNTKFDADNYGIFSIAIFGAVLYFCYLVDFFAIAKVGKLFFTEFAAMFSGAFKQYTVLRKISLVLWASIFVGFFLISFFTSYYGSDIVKAVAAPRADIESFERIGNARRAAEGDAFGTFGKRREKLEAARELELKNAGSPELRRLAKQGDNWANTELAQKNAAINKRFDNQLAEVDKAEKREKETFAKTHDALDAAKLQAAQSALSSQKTQADAIGFVTMAGGVAPLIIAVIIIGVMSVTEVSAKIDRAQKAAGQHSPNPPYSRNQNPQAQNFP